MAPGPFSFSSLRSPLLFGEGGHCCADFNIKMGSRLSAQQREIYTQVGESLVGGGKKFSKGSLKRFVRWLSFHFPGVSPQQLELVNFWDQVGQKLTALGAQGDTSVEKFFYLFVMIRQVVKEKGEMKGKPGRTSPVSVPPSPSPNPSSPKPGGLHGAARQRSQASLAGETSHCSPGPLQPPRYPCPGRPGHSARDLSPSPAFHKPVSPSYTPVHSPVSTPACSPIPSPANTPVATPRPILKTRKPTPKPSPVPTPCTTPKNSPKTVRFLSPGPRSQNGSRTPEPQDGAGHMAWPATCVSSSHNPFYPGPPPPPSPPPSLTPSPFPGTNPFQFPNSTPCSAQFPQVCPNPFLTPGTASCFSSCSTPMPGSHDVFLSPPESSGSAHCGCGQSLGPTLSTADPAYPLPTSGSHAPSSGSHGVGAGCNEPGAWNWEPPLQPHRSLTVDKGVIQIGDR